MISNNALDLAEAEQIAGTLAWWASELTDHAPLPSELRPAEMDRQVRDYVKDVTRDRLSYDLRSWAEYTSSHLDFVYRTVMRQPALTPQLREDVTYAYGRGTMALDLGDHAAAKRELERLETYRAALTDQHR